MSAAKLQVTARGPRLDAEVAAAAIDADPALDGIAYSIIEEDEARGLWRLDLVGSGARPRIRRRVLSVDLRQQLLDPVLPGN